MSLLCWFLSVCFCFVYVNQDGCILQLRKKGFCHIDALDPSEDMLSIARKDNLYENYYCEFLTEKQLPIAPGEISYQFVYICTSLKNLSSRKHAYISLTP